MLDLLKNAASTLGKGAGFFVVAFACISSFTSIMLLRPGIEPAALGMGIGAAVAAYYAGGGWKAHAEAKNGNGKPAA